MKNYKVPSNKLFLFFAVVFINVVFTAFDHKNTDDKNNSSKKISIPSVIAAPTATLTSSTGSIITIDSYRKTTDKAKFPVDFSVEITIKKENLSGYAKFIETLPAGFSATVIEAQGATFSFVNQKIIFVWNTLPSQNELKISYKVSFSPNVKGAQIIEGVFYFIENDRTLKFVLPQTSVNIIDPTIEQVIAGGANPKTPTVAPKPPVVDYYQISKSTQKKGVKKSAIGNIYYKVQFLALYQTSTTEPLVLDSIIGEPYTTTLTQGFLQYTIGPFGTFDEAAKHKDEMVLKGYPGSFIKAYMNKRRITIKEARALQEGK